MDPRLLGLEILKSIVYPCSWITLRPWSQYITRDIQYWTSGSLRRGSVLTNAPASNRLAAAGPEFRSIYCASAIAARTGFVSGYREMGSVERVRTVIAIWSWRFWPTP